MPEGILGATEAPDVVSALGAALGPFHFAWVDAGTAFDPAVHNREDENVFSFQVEHTEGDFAQLTLEIRNPRIGLLAPSRKVWAWLSWFNGTTVIPLFFGRLIGVPTNIYGEIVQLVFIARPSDFIDQKENLAATLRTFPYYDPIFIDEKRSLEPDVVLEARPELWHIDRLSHVVTTSNVLAGEDGLVAFTDDMVFDGSVSVSLNNIPLRAVEIDAEIPWTQTAIGYVPMSAFIHNSWPNENLNVQIATTFSGDGMISSFPKPDSNIGGGWEVYQSSVKSVANSAVPADLKAGSVINGMFVPIAVPPGSIVLATFGGQGFLNQMFGGTFIESIIVALWHLRFHMVVKYDVKRAFKERIKFTLKSDVQSVVTLPEDNERLLITVASRDVGEPLDPAFPDVLPIGDLRSRSYLPSARGRQSLEYLIALARANLAIRSRVVEIEFETQFENVIGLSLRKNGQVFDPRLPGGTAVGKIISYGFSLNGESGEIIGTVTLGCPIGYGNAIVLSDGDADYIEDDYIEIDMYERINQIVAVGGGDVGYTVPVDNPNDDGIEFRQGFQARDIVQQFQVFNYASIQRAAVLAVKAAPLKVLEEGQISEALQDIPTTVAIRFKPLTGGPFETIYNVVVTDLVLPAGINLEAAT